MPCFVNLNEKSLLNMQLIDVKSNKSLSKCHNSPIFILFISFYTFPGAGHLPVHSDPTPGNLPISFTKRVNARGGGGMGPGLID